MKKFTPEEINRISRNFIFIVQKCSLSQNEQDIVSLNTYKRLYSYSKLYQNNELGELSEWCPQEKTLLSIIECFRKCYEPKIGMHDLVNTLLEEREEEFISKNGTEDLIWYEGKYYCYYLNITGTSFNYGMMNVYRSKEGEYICEAIMDLSEESFNELASLIRNDNKPIGDTFEKYNNKKEFRSPYYYFSGDVMLLQDAVMMNLRAEKNAFSRIVTIRRFDRISNCKKYQGSIGTMLSTIFADKSTKFQHIGLSSTVIRNIEKFKELFEFSEDSKYVIISDMNELKNQQWFDSVVS